jgi:hypothetical protein
MSPRVMKFLKAVAVAVAGVIVSFLASPKDCRRPPL